MQRVDFLATNRNPELFRRDASFIYRCENLAHALEATGCDVGLHHIAHYDASVRARAVVLHRPQSSLRLKWLLRKLRRQGTCVIIDIDDLIFDPEFALYSPAAINGILPLSKMRRRFKRHGKALTLASAVTVSTTRLAEYVRRLFPALPVTVIRNSVHLTWRSANNKPPVSREPKRIVYHPGTRSHDADFHEVAPVLARFLHEHPDIRLQITGHLNHDLRAREGQIEHYPRVPFSEYADRIRPGWVNLCPLEPTPFNECKSAIKVIEAGYWNIPTICSPNPDAERFAQAGALVASTVQGWLDALELLLDDAVYKRRTEGLRARTLALADAHAEAEVFLELLDRYSV